MTSQQNIIEIVNDKIEKGELTVSEANVLMIQMEGVRIVRGKIFSDVRIALNMAVKNGLLGHLKKDGLKPEAYFNINARSRAIEMREAEMKESLSAISGICCSCSK